MPCGITIVHRVIGAISKQIIAQNIIICSYFSIHIDKPPHFGVIVAALEIVEARLLIVEISTVAQRIESRNGIVRSELRRAPNVIGVGCNKIAASVVDANNIALQVYIIIVQCAVVQETVSRAGLIIQEKQRVLPFFRPSSLPSM